MHKHANEIYDVSSNEYLYDHPSVWPGYGTGVAEAWPRHASARKDWLGEEWSRASRRMASAWPRYGLGVAPFPVHVDLAVGRLQRCLLSYCKHMLLHRGSIRAIAGLTPGERKVLQFTAWLHMLL